MPIPFNSALWLETVVCSSLGARSVCRLQVIVELRVVFLKIGEIDTLKEQYSADTFIQAKWREPALDGKSMEVLILECSLLGTPALRH